MVLVVKHFQKHELLGLKPLPIVHLSDRVTLQNAMVTSPDCLTTIYVSEKSELKDPENPGLEIAESTMQVQ